MTHLRDHGIEVILINGNAPWMAKRTRARYLSLAEILNVPGVALFEKQKAPLRLMSWCTYPMPESSKELLQVLSARCGEPTSTDAQLVAIAQTGLPNVDTVPLLKQWLLNQLLCHVDGTVLPNYWSVGRVFAQSAVATNHLHVGLLPSTATTMGQGKST